MNKYFMKRSILFYLILNFIVLLNCYSEDSISDEYSSLFLSFNYTSNTNALGQFSQFVQQPSYTPALSFYSKYNFDVSLLYSIIENSSADSLQNSSSEFDIILGYSFNIGNLTIYPSFSRYIYSENSNSIKSAYFRNIQLDLDYELRWYMPGISISHLSGDENSFFLSARNSVLIQKEDFILKNSLFFIQPELDLNFGGQEYLSNYVRENYFNDADYRERLSSSIQFRRRMNTLRSDFPGLSDREIFLLLTESNTEEEKKFNLSSVSFVLPVYYMIGPFTFSLSLLTFFPTNQPDYLEYEIQFYFDVGLSYTFDF